MTTTISQPTNQRTKSNRGIVDAEERRKRKALSARQGRKAQAAARLLLALCARAGEGRRRVLAELYSALSCNADGGGGGTRAPVGGEGRWVGCDERIMIGSGVGGREGNGEGKGKGRYVMPRQGSSRCGR